jgi:hypothetical protein
VVFPLSPADWILYHENHHDHAILATLGVLGGYFLRVLSACIQGSLFLILSARSAVQFDFDRRSSAVPWFLDDDSR